MPFLDSTRFVEVIQDDANSLTATPETTLNGYVFVGKSKRFQVGKIPILETSANVLLGNGDEYTVQFGYNPKEYRISVASLADQTKANAIASDIKNGKTCWVNGVMVTGTMPLIDTVAVTLKCGEHYSEPLGYHDGKSIITAASLASQTVSTAIASDLKMGRTCWVNGVMVTGTMPLIPTNQTTVIDAGKTYKIPAGYHDGTGVVSATTLAAQTSATATAGDIRNGKTAWANGVIITGTIKEIAASTYELPINGEYTIEPGIHGGLGKVTQNIPTITSLTITPTFEDQTVSVAGKYMVNDITVTGLNAWNFNNFDADGGVVVDNVQVDFQTDHKTEYELGIIPTDNWHDQATNNLYQVSIQVLSHVDSSIVLVDVDGLVFLNNLNAAAKDTSRLYIGDGNYIEAYVNKTNGSNSHTFKLVCPNTTSMWGMAYVTIREVVQMRRYGDAHDTQTTVIE